MPRLPLHFISTTGRLSKRGPTSSLLFLRAETGRCIIPPHRGNAVVRLEPANCLGEGAVRSKVRCKSGNNFFVSLNRRRVLIKEHRIMQAQTGFCGAVCSLLLRGLRVRLLCIQTPPLSLTSSNSTHGLGAGSYSVPGGLANIERTRRLQCLLLAVTRTATQFDISDSASACGRLEGRFTAGVAGSSSAIYLEDELRGLALLFAPPVQPCTLVLPEGGNPNLGGSSGGGGVSVTVTFAISAVSFGAVAALHPGLRVWQCFQLVPRAQLHPACIRGNALQITPCAASARSRQSRLSLLALARNLGALDSLLVLRTRNEARGCDEFWALIPPSVAALEEGEAGGGGAAVPWMFMLQLHDSEGILDYTALSTPRPGVQPQPKAQKEEEVEAEAELLDFMAQAIGCSLRAGLGPGDKGEGAGGSFYNPLVAVGGGVQSAIAARLHEEGEGSRHWSNQKNQNQNQNQTAVQHQHQNPHQPLHHSHAPPQTQAQTQAQAQAQTQAQAQAVPPAKRVKFNPNTIPVQYPPTKRQQAVAVQKKQNVVKRSNYKSGAVGGRSAPSFVADLWLSEEEDDIQEGDVFDFVQ